MHMLIGFSVIMLSGLIFSKIFKKIGMPGLFGMIIAGIIIGPGFANIIDISVMELSPYIRKIALVIILIRAGLSLDIEDCKRIGKAAFLMSFVPAVFEISAIIFLSVRLFKLEFIDAAILGSVIAAVSPAVIVPKMIKIMEEGYGTGKKIPQLILAGASIDDVFVIVLFTTFIGFTKGEGLSVYKILTIPLSIFIGASIGALIAYILVKLFRWIKIRDTEKMIILVGIAFALLYLEENISSYIPFSALIVIMTIGTIIRSMNKELAARLSIRFNKIWVLAEIYLFTLIGIALDISVLSGIWIPIVVMILSALIFRVLGVYLCLIKTDLNIREKVFCMVSYTPKATVQAAIGSIPLFLGLKGGSITLMAAVLSILITAPLGAFIIEKIYKKCLVKGE